MYLLDAWYSLSAVGTSSPNTYGYPSSCRGSTIADDCLRKTTWWLRASNRFPSATLYRDIVNPNLPTIRTTRRTQELIASRNLDIEDRQRILLPVNINREQHIFKIPVYQIFILLRKSLITWRSNWRVPMRLILLEFGSIRSTNTVPDVLAELAKDCPWSHTVKPTSGPPLCMYVCL